MAIVLITGSAGLIGAESSRFFVDKGFDIVGIDNDMRGFFFGEEASTTPFANNIKARLGKRYRHIDCDIRNDERMSRLFRTYGKDIALIIHAAAQPSHDWAATNPLTNFKINTNATFVLLEEARQHCPEAPFIFLSSNKVYGDHVNRLPLQELASRYDIVGHLGIDEGMSIDGSMHSLYGASKAAADLAVQEYGLYYGMKTVCFRCSCLSGPGHAGTQMHGFLSYLMKCVVSGKPYQVIGFLGKQVRDNIHSRDVVEAFWQYYNDPTIGDVYNLGGGRGNEYSILEAIQACQELSGNNLQWSYVEEARRGDHKWWITDNKKFQARYQTWKISYDVKATLREIYESVVEQALPHKRYA